MKIRTILLAFGILVLASQMGRAEALPGLVVYGPGGPHHVMQECAELYQDRYGEPVAVIRAMPAELEKRLAEDGDLYYGGADDMMVDIFDRHPDLLDLQTVEALHPRRVGILVRKGNPLEISSPADLHRDGVDLLNVKLEDMASFQRRPGGGWNNVRQTAYTGKQGVKAWHENRQLDAWVTYRTWYQQLENHAEFIDISHLRGGLRYTPIAVTQRSSLREQALHFIAFLKSEDAREIFRAHGWY